VILVLAASVAWSLAPECAALVTTSDINRCEGQAFQKADRALNVQWKASLAAMKRRDAGLQDPRSHPPSYTEALIAAQRAWLKFRDTNCLVWGYRVRGGTAQPAREMACQTSVTLERIRELRDQVKRY
jgi:uncharacterized protein YecT (DUF1311 family)